MTLRNWKYDQTYVRRQDRLLEEDRAHEILAQGELGILSMVDPDGKAYGIPVNFIWDGADSIYIHCAPEGRKLCCILEHPQVSFCIIGNTHVLPDKFTTNYESIVLDCIAHTGLPKDERWHALELLIEKYSSEYMEIGRKYLEKSFFRTQIIRLEILSASGKSKNIRY